MKKIIDRIVLGSGSPNKNDLWIDDRNGLEMKVYDDGEWKPMAGGSGDDGESAGGDKTAENFFKFFFPPEQGKISGILKLVSNEPWNYGAYHNNGVIEPLPDDTAVFYDLATITDEDIATIWQDLANHIVGYYMLVRSEPIEEDYGDTHVAVMQDIYYSDGGTIGFSESSNICYGIKVDGHDCFWYGYYD